MPEIGETQHSDKERLAFRNELDRLAATKSTKLIRFEGETDVNALCPPTSKKKRKVHGKVYRTKNAVTSTPKAKAQDKQKNNKRKGA